MKKTQNIVPRICISAHNSSECSAASVQFALFHDLTPAILLPFPTTCVHLRRCAPAALRSVAPDSATQSTPVPESPESTMSTAATADSDEGDEGATERSEPAEINVAKQKASLMRLILATRLGRCDTRGTRALSAVMIWSVCEICGVMCMRWISVEEADDCVLFLLFCSGVSVESRPIELQSHARNSGGCT